MRIKLSFKKHRPFAEHLIVVGRRFKKLRKKQRKSLKDVSKQTEIGINQLKSVEAGLMADLRMEMLWILSDYYGVRFHDIYKD